MGDMRNFHLNAPAPRQEAIGGRRRAFNAAQQTRLTSSWGTTPSNINQLLHRDRRILVARSRDLKINNEYAKQFITLMKSNVPGASGFTVSVQCLRENGEIDELDSAACEKAYAQQSQLGYFDATGKLSRTDAERLYVETLATDGEVLIRRLKGRGPHGYQLQFLDSLLLDDTYNKDLDGNKKIRMGVEMDAFGKPLAYHLLPERINDINSLGVTWAGGERVRVSADEIWHDFVVENVGQVRGIPWLATSAMAMNMLEGYEEAAVIAARGGAAKMGFFVTNEDAPVSTAGPAEALADSQDENGNFITEAEPGSMTVLPHGYDFKSFDPDYPHAMFGEFVSQCLRRVSAGLPGASYTALSGDLRGASYSGLRVDFLRDRETWKGIQQFVCERFVSRSYSEWLPYALLGGHIVGANGRPLPFSKLYKYDSAYCQGARWPWVDMEKEARANALMVAEGFTSRGRVIREQGGDPERIWKELEKENKRLKGILPEPKPAHSMPTQAPANAGVVVSED